MQGEDFLKKIKALDWKGFLYHFFSRKINFVTIILALCLLYYWGYLWYFYIFNPAWDENEKQVYMDEKFKQNTAFDEKKFEEIVQETLVRKSAFDEQMSVRQDIFRLK
ncbi:MAG: hypothetical protein KIH89_004730 [Candidatus Shapirobacteria bacterium]|nr:hypothetical protein [Candidatus Shapirobacteria bacterium]